MELRLYPLRVVEHRHRQRLARILWDWKMCGKCDAKPGCLDGQCPWSRTGVLGKFWDRYENVTAVYIPESVAQQPCLESHDQLLNLVAEIKRDRDTSRAELTRRFFHNGHTTTAQSTSIADENVAVNIAAFVLLSMGRGTRQELSDLTTDDGPMLLPWRDSVSVRGFVDEAFHRNVHPYFDGQQDQQRMQHILASLTAVNLVRHANLHLEATADIRQHLMMDRKTGILWVYDCTPVLKEMLTATLVDSEACILPRALVLEVMHSLYKILFPPGQNSENLLSELVRKHGFDADLLQYEFARYQREDDPVVDFSYFSTRLAETYEELQDPSPRNQLESWFERKSGARHMFKATMIGVFIAVIIGILGLGISGFQAYVSYQQWKHPAKDARDVSVFFDKG